MKTRSISFFASAAAMVVLGLGCSTTSSPNYASLGLVNVAGTVTLDGIPFADVEVRLETPEDGIYSYGTTDSSGRFELMFDSRTPGIIPGKKRVVIVPKRKAESELTGTVDSETATQVDGELTKDEDGEPLENTPSSVPSCYGRASTYFVQVDGATRSLALELRSDCSNATSTPSTP